MSIRLYFILMSLTTAICWAGWGMIVVTMNAGHAGLLSLSLFYGSLFLSLVGTFSLLGFGVRVLARPEEVVIRHVRTSLRQGLLLALLVVAILVLQSYRYLYWWNILLVVAILGLLEVLALSYRTTSHTAT
jgi:hypothetical protein